VDAGLARERFGGGAVARLATVTADGRPHVVPCCFALDRSTIYSAVDAKPKRSRRLRRLDNVRAVPWASLVVDHYESDWSALWWVRADGPARVLEAGNEFTNGIELLVAKYAQYRDRPPDGPLLVVEAQRWRAWP
jgi:PPOX class probable F420-dependent enzyme